MFRAMAPRLLVALLLSVLLQRNRGFVLLQDDSDLDLDPGGMLISAVPPGEPSSREKEEPFSADDVSQSIMASFSPQQLAEDDALLKTIVHDATSSDDDFDATETQAMFLSTVLHLVGQGEMYRDARMDAITAALRSAFLATTGRVDRDYIEEVLRAIGERDERNRRQGDEHQTNVLRLVHHEHQELLDRGTSLPPPGGVAEKQ